MPSVEVIGLYPVDAPEPCHLVEVLVRSSDGPFDVGEFTQSDPTLPRSNWQVAYAEKLLDPGGHRVVWDLWHGPGDEGLWRGDVRLVFFFHFLEAELPLATPFGDVRLPAATGRPRRLDGIEYEEP